ncbi:hypothetical protein [Larkinella rosea]|uniref:Uncharacterized protein n=1 Tax=Larkinella rosea TaxID=2025312 RepID=A0A3P1BRQ1_9BACT|nr:hypothetical protein [Larkinella rosea]RRB03775.1 hypothetical protein EHT25_09555 [Larkinella rosea]
MKRDISFLPVEGIQVVIARKPTELDQYDWQVYLINQNNVMIRNVFVTSKGYGFRDETQQQQQTTSTLRHYFAELQPNEHVAVETIMPDVFHLNNQYWVSYYIGDQIFDKKFIFVPDSITEQNLIPIHELGLDGILHT